MKETSMIERSANKHKR